MISFWNDTVTRLRPGTTTERGSTIADWSAPNELIIGHCSVQPATTSLSQDGRVLGITEGLTAYLPAGSDVQAGDRIRFGGDIYTINGEPKVWQSPTGLVSNIQLNLVRWSG